MAKISESRLRSLKALVEYYELLRTDFDQLGRFLLTHLVDDSRLRPLIHSGKYRTKDPTHLLDKLKRKEIERLLKRKEDRPPLIKKENLLEQIEDLVGVRLLHLHTQQMGSIHPRILQILERNNYVLVEEPVVYFWDLENQTFFGQLGIRTIPRKEMYTSVHYVVSAASRPEMRIELQVRTLMEEVWGEVSHTINYPHETEILSCKEQLLALARITSGCIRLVDSIFSTYNDQNGQR